MRISKKNLPDLTNLRPGGYWTGDLWSFQGKIGQRRRPRARFLCNLFLVDEQGKVWLGVRRTVRKTPGKSAEWFAAPVVTGGQARFTPAPDNWRDYVCASQVIPLMSS